MPRLSGKGAEREIEEDDFATAFYENDQIDLGAADARAAVSGRADEAALRRRLPGVVPGVRDEPESRRCECRRDWDDPRLGDR